MTSQKSTKATTQRRQRVPLGGHRRRLNIPAKLENDDKHHYHWFNDVESRVEDARAAGYEFVTKKELGLEDVGDPDLHNQNSDLNSRVSKRLRDFVVYLMRIPIEFYNEDQKLKHEHADQIDEAIYGGGADKVDNSYGLDVRYKR